MSGFIEEQEEKARIFHKLMIAWLIIGTCGIGIGFGWILTILCILGECK